MDTLPPITYDATVVRTVDGDTVYVSVDGWPEPFNPIEARVDGIDTPESRTPPAKCEKEVRLGVIAKARAKELLPPGTKVKITWEHKHEKYGRLLGKITLPSGRDFAEILVREGHAVPYDGGTKQSWCR